MSQPKKHQLTRRNFVRALGVTGLTCASTAGGVMGFAQPAAAADINKLINEKMGPGTVTVGKVTLGAPAIAENAKLVKVPVKVDHPMEDGNYIQAIGIFVDNNPIQFIGRFSPTPRPNADARPTAQPPARLCRHWLRTQH